jgi:DNA-binding GntR family transcriptional regulator
MAALHATDFEDQTLNARVLAQIRADIVSCRLMPNERLRLDALRERYQAGSTPIREALMWLEAEGLVRLEHNKGFRVAEVSRESLFDLMQTRMEIESIALRWCIERGGVEWEADVVAAFHRLSRQSKWKASGSDVISPEWWREHRIFHQTLIAACGSPTLRGICGSLFDKAERYVALSIISKVPPRNDVAEHEEIMRAALGRDAERAVALNRAHIERTLQKVAKSFAGRANNGAPTRGKLAKADFTA